MLAVAACGAATVLLVLGLVEADPRTASGELAVRGLGVAAPVAFGLWRLRRGDDRLAACLIGAGLLWSVTTLAQSGDPVLYSLGRTAAWLVEPVIIYLLLAFPSGRLTGRTPRRLLAAAVALVALLYLPGVLLDPFPAPSPWSSCGLHCPDNAFALGDGHAALVTDVIRPLREVLTTILFALIALWLARRARGAPPLLRRALGPVVVIAVCRAIVVPLYDAARAISEHGGVTQIAAWLFLLSLPAVTAAFAVGLLNQRLFVADGLKRLTLGLPSNPDTSQLRAALADALQDPSLRLLFKADGERTGWVGEDGLPVAAPADARWSAQTVTEVGANGHRMAVVADTGFAEDPAFVRAATTYAMTTLENDRLAGRLRASVIELGQSRARIVAVAARERRKIERDLHDGAQQRLVALRIKLELAAEELEEASPQAAATIRGLEVDVDATVDEVRSFARGIYPGLLADRGISEALRAAGRTAPVPVLVDAAGLGRYAPEIEATVYFSCFEALQNAAKHAPGASVTVVVVVVEHDLHFEVHDEGPGFDTEHVERGAGLVNMSDRLAAVGGTLEVRSELGEGTRVIGSIPVG